MDVASVVSLDILSNQDFAFQNQKTTLTLIVQFSTKTIVASNVQRDFSTADNSKTVSWPIHCVKPMILMEPAHHATLDMLLKV